MKKITVILVALCFSLVSLAGNGKVKKIKNTKVSFKSEKKVVKREYCAFFSMPWGESCGPNCVMVGTCKATRCADSPETAGANAMVAVLNGSCAAQHIYN